MAARRLACHDLSSVPKTQPGLSADRLRPRRRWPSDRLGGALGRRRRRRKARHPLCRLRQLPLGPALDLRPSTRPRSRPASSPRPWSPVAATPRRSSTSKASRSMAMAASGSPRKAARDRLTPHALYHVDADGKIVEEVAFPEALLPSEIRFGCGRRHQGRRHALGRHPARVEGRSGRDGEAPRLRHQGKEVVCRALPARGRR